MENQKDKSTKKGTKLSLSVMVMTGVVVASSLLMGACPSPTGGGGGNGNPGIPGEPGGHEHQWGATVTNTSWKFFTDTAATADAAGTGHKIGTETKTRTCATDGTIETIEVRTYVPLTPAVPGDTIIDPATGQQTIIAPQDEKPAQNTDLRLPVTIDKNRVLHEDGSTTVLDPSKETGGGTTETSLPSTAITNFPTSTNNISMINVVMGVNTHGNIHGATEGDAMAKIVIYDALPLLSKQAKALEDFFAHSTGATPELQATLNELRDAEAKIRAGKNGGTGDVTITTFLDGMDSLINTLETKIKASNGGSLTDAYDAYKKGQYLTNRDWATEADAGTTHAALDVAVTAFKTARDKIATPSSAAYAARTTNIPIGDYPGVQAQFGVMATTMRTQILTALGLTGLSGEQQDRANAMADALIIQLQDTEELRAFKADVTAEAGITTNDVLNYNGATSSMATQPSYPVAQAGQQSSDVRLASVNAEFPPDGIKGAYGRGYTGKKDDKMA
ncbi:hypothetical protein AGMMS50268_18790 [Spirochaetia bacterium]|nr:hypothetical protein AGMMS50268_18790 [Spirochaetia bacterium]